MKSSRLLKGTLCVVACMLLVHADNLSVTFTAAGFNKEYDVIVWIENGSSAFVKTVAIWGSDRRDVSPWSSLSTSTVDATTSATQSSTKNLSASWNGTNVSKAEVSNGTYFLCISGGIDGGPFPLSKTQFTFDGTSKTITGSSTNFTNISIKITGKGSSAVSPPTIPSASDKSASISLFAPNGALIMKRDIARQGIGRVLCGLFVDQKPGIYLVSIKTNGVTMTKKFNLAR